MCNFLINVEAHHALYLLRNCLSLPKLLYFLRTSSCFKESKLLQEYDTLVVGALSQCVNVRLCPNSRLQSLLPISMGGLDLSSALHLALPAFLASAAGCSSLIMAILGPLGASLSDIDFSSAFNLWSPFSETTSIPPSPEFQKSWTTPIYKDLSSQLFGALDSNEQKRLLCYQGKTAAAWLNALPCQSLGLKLTNTQLRISISLRVGAPVCVEHSCVCGKQVDSSGLHWPFVLSQCRKICKTFHAKSNH